MVRLLLAGRLSQWGLYGALFGEAGFTGIVDVLESPYGGFCTTFSRSSDRFDLAQLVKGLGTEWQTLGVALKFYACVGSNHTTLDAIREMQSERPFSAREVDRVVVHGSRATVEHVGWKYVPQGLTSAQLNLPYSVATLLLEGDCFVEQFAEGNVADPARMALAGRVEIRHDPAITARGALYRHAVRVEAHLNDGTRMERSIEAPRGSESKFASDAEVVAKFEKLGRRALPSGQLAQLRDAVMALEDLSDARRIAALLSR